MAVSENDLIVGPLVPANGVSVISLDFYFEDEAWLEVYKNDSETPLVLSVDYTTTGEGTATGTVVLTTPANGTDAYSVYLVVPLERTSDMQLRGEFRSEPFNLEMDRMWQALQGRRTASDRTMRFASAGQTLDPFYIPSAGAAADRFPRISSDGLSLELSTFTETELAAGQVNAAASAVAAAASAATAEAARDATLAAYDNFDDRYLGEFAVPPTTDNDGDPLASGMLYFDTVTDAMKVYSETSMAWLDAYASGETFIAKATFTAADQMLYSTAAGVPATTPITAVGRAILDDATIADVRNTIQASRVPLDEDDFASDSALHPPTQQSARAYFRGLMLGVDQTWQDVIGSRSAGTSYQNTTGKPIEVAVFATVASGLRLVQVSSDNSTWIDIARGSSAQALAAQISIPDNWYYRIDSATSVTVTVWAELR